MARTVLFWDLDGTLLLTGKAGILAYEAAFEELTGRPVDLSALSTPGMPDTAVAAHVLELAGEEPTPELAEALLRAYERHMPDALPKRDGYVLTGVREVLEDLDGRDDVRSYLLTGNTPTGARHKLVHYGLDRFFPEGEGAFSIDAGTRIDIARRAMQFAEDAEHVYVIGDTPADVECGKAIDARTIAVGSGWHDEEELVACEPWLYLPELPPPDEFKRLLGISL